MNTEMTNFDGVRVALTRGTTLIEASAGTGKTYSIATLYLRLVMEEGVRVEQILAVTYTEAATKELIGRIRQRLYEAQRELERWRSSGETPTEAVLLAWLEPGREPAEVREAVARLSSAVQLFDDAVISTIHGFCYRALQEFAFESGARYAAELLGESVELYDRVAADFWRRRICTASPLLSSLLLQAGLADLAPWSGLLRRGGKYVGCPVLPELATLSLEEREAGLAERFAQVRRLWQSDRATILALVDGKKAGMSEAAAAFPPGLLAEHAVAMDEMVASGEGRVSAGAVAAMRKFSASSVERLTLKNKPVPQHPFFQACEGAEAEKAEFFLAFRKQFLAEAADALERLKRERNVLLFDDLLRVFHAALMGPGGDRLAEAVGRRFDAVLIDEFQDTDPLQAEIFERLFAGGAHRLFLIGDPKQAIYAFRGADLHAYLAAARKAERSFGLAVNWRSDAALLEGMNAFFSGNENPFMEEAIRYRPVEAAPKNLVGREKGAPLVLRWVQGEKTLSKEKGQQRVISDIVEQILLRRTEYAYGEMAVLVRNHREAAAVQEALLGRGIPAVRQTRESVLESEEAAQLLAVMEAVAEPQQSGRVARALLVPLFRAGTEADEEQVARFLEWRVCWREEGFMAMWQRLLVECGGRRRLLRRLRGERRLTNFLHLAELLHAEEAERKLGPESLLVRFHALRDAGEEAGDATELRLESDAEAVQLVTIHKSKGLEYPLVFVPFLWREGRKVEGAEVLFHDEEGRLTLDLRGSGAPQEVLDQAAHEEAAERLRLLYVAVTRARHCCVIHWGDFLGYKASPLGYLLPDQESAQALAERAPGCVALEWVDEAEGGWVPVEAEEVIVRGAREFARTLVRPAFTTSFTGLTRGAPAEAPERDEAMEEPVALTVEEGEPEGIHAFAKGARAGDFVHDLMESVPFEADAAGVAARREVIAARLALYGYEATPWLEVLDEVIASALDLELEPGLRLAEVPRSERLAEVDFSCRLPRLRPEDLVALARKHPEELAEAEFAGMKFGEVQGFLRGAIDLFFRHEGRYYLLDWKSNWLGRSEAAYTPARMQAAMREHHYGLQARLYTLAADRYLRLRVPGYDYERDFGGVFYLFLRGVESEGGGVVRLRASLALVESMREWMEVRV